MVCTYTALCSTSLLAAKVLYSSFLFSHSHNDNSSLSRFSVLPKSTSMYVISVLWDDSELRPLQIDNIEKITNVFSEGETEIYGG